MHGWSPECNRGVQGIGRFVKQWQEPLPQPAHSHSEQRKRQPTRPLVRQQNHSPVVVQPLGQPAPSWQVLHGKPMFSQSVLGEEHGLRQGAAQQSRAKRPFS